MSIETRVEELKKLPYQKIKAIADELGVTKEETAKWQDEEVLGAIARAENKKTVHSELSKKQNLPQPPPPPTKKNGILYCGVCQKRLTTDTQGNATCH